MARLQPGINDLATVNPSLAAEWDYEANKNLKTEKGRDISTPDKVTSGSEQKVWWTCSVCGYQWKSTVKDRSHGRGCPCCSMQIVVQGKDLTTTHPELAKQWDYEANKGLKNGHGKDISTPDKISRGSTVKVGWICPVCGYKWKAAVKDRTHGYGCPCCSGLVVAPGKDLLSMFPKIAAQWDYEANKNLRDRHGRDVSTPDKISYGSSVEVGWRCNVCGQSWETSVGTRTSGGNGCPYCSGHYPIPNKTDLKTVNPILADEWNYEKNKNLTRVSDGMDISSPEKISAHSHQCVWWRCSVCGCEWKASVYDRTRGHNGCPDCFVNNKSLKATHPEIAALWDYEKNKGLTDWLGHDISTPDKITFGSEQKVWWKCSDCGHEWNQMIKSLTSNKSSRCPACNESNGEKAIRKVLESKNIKFKKENTFKGRYFTSKKVLLRDDFAILDDHDRVIATIEYNGQQHYEPVQYGNMSYNDACEQLKKTQARDKIKSDYLKAHNIPQLIIPYWEFNKIKFKVKDFISAISSECKNFITC